MSRCGKEILISREGSDKHRRFPEALSPDSVKLNDFGLKDWMQFAVRFAEKINFFETTSSEIPSGNWTDFFIADNEINDFLKSVSTGNKIPPQLALFVSFVGLLEFTQKRFNLLTKRHLDFYYQQVLQTKKLEATPDSVHLVFELAKNFVSEKVAAGTPVEAGKDASGKKLIYKTTEEIIVNKARVAALKTVYHQPGLNCIKADDTAGEPKKPDGGKMDLLAKWWPFGYINDADFAELPSARIGFSIASKLLEMSTGNRAVLISVQFEQPIKPVDAKILTENLEISCTGEKGWTAPLKALPETLNESGKKIFTTGVKSKETKLDITFLIPTDEKAIVAFNPKIHSGNYQPGLPVCRVLIDTGKPDGYQLFANLASRKLVNIVVTTDVSGIKDFSLANDQGKLDSNKPFFPFGTLPVRNANFNLSHTEIFSKPWKTLNFNIEWKNTPSKINGSKRDSFADLYLQYRKSYQHDAKAETYMALSSGVTDLIVENNAHFSASLSVCNKRKWQVSKPEMVLFNWKNDKFETSETVVNNSTYSPDAETVIRLSSNKSFYHEMYPRIYALALSCNEKKVPLPNEPYTPFAENISVSYTAEQQLFATGWPANEQEPLFVYHEHPFGQSKLLIGNLKSGGLVPEYKTGGQLYIGIADVLPRQQISLLIQLFEGSENPEVETFGPHEKIEWSVLCNNQWKVLGPESVICDQTGNFLKSGLVKIALPAEATDSNTILTAGLIWLKVSMQKTYNAVCKVIGINAQAVEARFENNNNDLSHLLSGLKENSVSKLAGKVPGIKGLSQPYSSFGGKAGEDETAYYQRISDRLRHKNRAITLWDYERLILQHFPEIYKVKCVNHTKPAIVNDSATISFLSPGNVLVAVIPDIQNKNVFDIFEPRLSQSKLNEIEVFTNKYNSLHVSARVINPGYEKVTVSLKVKFRQGFDEIYYQQVLNDDIVKMLSPWAFDKTAGLKFGVTLHRSAVINYIEKLEYVDYIEDLVLSKEPANNLVNMAPENPVSILVSAKKHNISLVKVK